MERSKGLSDTFGMMMLRFKNWFFSATRQLQDAGVFQVFIDGLKGVWQWLEELNNNEAIKRFAESLAANLRYLEMRLGSIRDVLGEWMNDLGLAQYKSQALSAVLFLLAANFVGLAAAAIRVGIALLMTPIAWLGAALIGLFVIIDDMMSYMEGGESFIGQLMRDYPVLQTVVNILKDVWNWLGMLASSARELWSEMTIAFGAFDTGESLALEMRNAVGFAFDSIGKAVSAVAPIIGFFIYLLGMVARGWILIGATAAGFIAELIQGLVMIVSYIVGAVANAIQVIINFFMVDIPNAARKLVTDTLASWQELASKAESLIPDWLRNLFSSKSSTVNLNVSGGVPAGALAGAGGIGGNTTITNNVTVPTVAGAAQVVGAANSGFKDQMRSARSGPQQ